MFSAPNTNNKYCFHLLMHPPACDSCVMTLLKDLSTIGDELQLIKSQLQNVHASSHTLEQMRHLETRIKDLKVGTHIQKSRFQIKLIRAQPRNFIFLSPCKETYIKAWFQIPHADSTGLHLLEDSCFHVILWKRISLPAFSEACSPWKLYLQDFPIALSFSSTYTSALPKILNIPIANTKIHPKNNFFGWNSSCYAHR